MPEVQTIKIDKPSVILPLEQYEGLKETLEILSDTELAKSISRALSESKESCKTHEEIFGEE